MEKPEARKRGPRTDGDAREAIVNAARSLFMDLGVDRVSARRIASEANVDPSLVRYYFGSTEALLEEALRIPDELRVPFRNLPSLPVTDRGRAYLEACLDVWEHPMGVTIMRWVAFAAERDNEAYRRLVQLTTEGVRLALPEDTPLDEAGVRSGLVSTVAAGLGVTRYIWKLEPIASMPRDQLVSSHAPVVQSFLADPLPFQPAPEPTE
jgi:AcrR family transcriptional regulator